jgi:hypothetical protein
LGLAKVYSMPGEVKFAMPKYINGVFEQLPSDLDREAPTTAANHLFCTIFYNHGRQHFKIKVKHTD